MPRLLWVHAGRGVHHFEFHRPSRHPRVRRCSGTKWTVRNVAIDAVLRNYSTLLQAFERISAESHDDYGRTANGILTMLDKFNVYFGLKISFLVYGATEEVSELCKQEILHYNKLLLLLTRVNSSIKDKGMTVRLRHFK